MDKSFQYISSFYLTAFCCILLGLSGCENPGSVGSGVTDPGSAVVIDTITVSGVRAVSPVSYSGELEFFSAGTYDDPLFGSMIATGYLKPNLPASSDTVRDGAKMLMSLEFDPTQVYGDTLSSQDFEIYEIDEIWRDKALKVNDEIRVNQNNQVGSFTVENEDSIAVELSSEWVDKYRQYSDTTDADSLYKLDIFGLALVPKNGSKVIPIIRDSTRFIIQNPESDTFNVSLNQWGYTLERGDNSSIPQGSVPFYSTYESIINFGDLGINDLNIKAPGLSRAELILHEDSFEMEQSLNSEPSSVQRADESTVFLHLADPNDTPENIDPGVPLSQITRVQGSYNKSNGTFRFDVTDLVERIMRSGMPEGQEFFVTLPNDGVIKTSLIYTDDDQTPVEFRPKIIITSLKNTNN